MSGKQIKIGEYRAGCGWEVHVATSDAAEFCAFLGKLSPEDKERYAPIPSTWQNTPDGSATFVLGLHRSREEVFKLCERFIIHA